MSSEQQYRELRAAGWTLFHSAVAERQVLDARTWLDWIASTDPIPAMLEADLEPADDPATRRAVRRLRRLLWYDSAFWGPWLAASGVAAKMREVIGMPATVIFHAAFLKPPLVGTEVRAHQDQVFWEARYERTYTWWVSLDQSDRSNGCLELFPATFRSPLLPHHLDGAYRWHRILDESLGDLEPGVAVEMHPGDVLVFDSHIVHRSAANTSSSPRRALSFVAVRSDAPQFSSADRFDL
jgi:hypothetical protein